MPRALFFLLILAGSLLPDRGRASVQSVAVSFYSERLNIIYNTDFPLPYNSAITERGLVEYFHQLQRRDFRTLLTALEEQRTALRLNDWLYYELAQNTVRQIAPGHNAAQQELICWFLLSQTGFDTRLTFRGQEVFLNVFSTEEVFEVPLIQDRGRTFVNLTSIHRRPETESPSLYLLNFAPRPDGRSFSFYLPQLPRLKPQIQSRSFRFTFGEYVYQIDVDVDKTIVDIMNGYPFISEQQYLEAPLSPVVASSLLPQLRRMISGKSEREAVEFLVAFTRSSFPYMDDKEYFGYSRPMIADEVFYYPVSDCEDRAALFYQLVRELLDLPMVVIAFDDHLTIGVALTQPGGEAVVVNGRPYYICDPTGPVNSTAIGRFPKGYETRPFDIIGRHK